MSLQLVPCSITDANVFVGRYHRHHQPLKAQFLFAVAVADGGDVVGVAIIGRPVARALEDGWTAEVRRVAVADGHKNACSMLYGASWRACRALGYKRLITYTFKSEGGASLRAAGWSIVGEVTADRSWQADSKARPRVDRHPLQAKFRWEVSA